MFTRAECQQLGQAARAIGRALGHGATALIEAFAAGLGAGGAAALT